MGLKPAEIQSLTPRELARMWDIYFQLQSDQMDRVATAIFWIRSMLDSNITFEMIRDSLGWQKQDK